MIGSVLRIRYEITELLLKGPIFTAYAAKDRVQGRDVAVRVFNEPFAREPEFAKAVKDVVERSQTFQTPGIEGLIDVDDHEGQPFLITEYSKGQLLSDRINNLAPFSVSVAVSMAISICDALSSLHQQGRAHGDVSSTNIVAMPDGQCRIQLAGIWEAYSASQTAGSVALPSMAPYLAPEVSAGGMPSPSSDTYSVGILLYQLLSGRLPYSADTAVAMALKHATAGVPSVKIYNSATPAALDDIIKRAMAKDPAVRYSNASELLSDLRILQDGLRFGKPVTLPVKKVESETKQPVAPKMSAIRDAEKDKKKKVKEPRDVPIWLTVSVVFFGAIMLSLLGVWIVFNMSQPKLVSVPNVKGSKVAEAQKTLASLKLKLRISGRETNENLPPDTILSMSPEPDRKLHEGSTINVKISTGSRYVALPDLTGKSVDTARSMLEPLNILVDDQMVTQPDPKIEMGMIISQDPPSKTKVDRYSKVRLVVSSGKSGESSGQGDEDKQYLYTLKIKMTGIEEAVLLRVDITDTHGTRTVYEQQHAPDDNVVIPAQGYGKQAKFIIYYDGQVVKELEKQAEEEAPNP